MNCTQRALAALCLLLAAPACSERQSEPPAQPAAVETEQAPAPAVQSPPGQFLRPASFTEVVRQASPAVVSIYTREVSPRRGNVLTPLFPGAPEDLLAESLGTGFVIDPGGVVVTNHHVVSGAAAIRVRTADGQEYAARRVGSDPGTDLAVLQVVDAPRLAALPLGDSDKVEVGQWVVAIGNALGLRSTVTAGIISAKGRSDVPLQGQVRYVDYLQTDASINPGNSGGPLVNLRGEVIGLNTAIASNSGGSEGIAFAIPISMVMFVSDQLVRTGTVSRAYLGVTLDSMFTQDVAHRLGLERPIGARVSAVTQGSPADRAGIKPNDVIFRYDGTPIEDDDHLVCLVSMTPTDQKVTLGVFRNRKMIELAMPVASRDQFE